LGSGRRRSPIDTLVGRVGWYFVNR
jgi:hypothetical protein